MQTQKKVFLTGEWNDLLMANYEVDPALLQQFVPHKTELDSFDGKHYVSLVAFMFNKVRIRGISIPFHVNFPEVNLRLYVRYRSDGVWRRGVVFIREIVPLPAIAIVANALYREKYSWTSMRHRNAKTNNGRFIEHQWKWKGRWNTLSARSSDPAIPIRENSIEDFITNHYWGYSAVTSAITNEYAVEHPQWNIHPVIDSTIDCDFASLYGSQFEILRNTTPHSVFHAVGSSILIRGKTVL